LVKHNFGSMTRKKRWGADHRGEVRTRRGRMPKTDARGALSSVGSILETSWSKCKRNWNAPKPFDQKSEGDLNLLRCKGVLLERGKKNKVSIR